MLQGIKWGLAEGHGFYKPENQQEYYTRLLAFFNRHLGGATAK